MWQSPGQRAKALARIKERERQRQKNRFHVKRVHAELKLSDGPARPTPDVVQARAFLNDLTSVGLSLFTTDPFVVGQEIALNIPEPLRFFVKGRVVWCMEHSLGASTHVISDVTFPYRIGIEFKFESPEEEKNVQKFVEQISADYVTPTDRAA